MPVRTDPDELHCPIIFLVKLIPVAALVLFIPMILAVANTLVIVLLSTLTELDPENDEPRLITVIDPEDESESKVLPEIIFIFPPPHLVISIQLILPAFERQLKKELPVIILEGEPDRVPSMLEIPVILDDPRQLILEKLLLT